MPLKLGLPSRKRESQDSKSVCGGKDPAQRLEGGVLSPERICSRDSKLNQQRVLYHLQMSPVAPLSVEVTPHLWMNIEVFIGFKALSLTLRVVKQKAFFDDEKPMGRHKKKKKTERSCESTAPLGALDSHGSPWGHQFPLPIAQRSQRSPG